jgi:aspartyl-tRNA synthetase
MISDVANMVGQEVVLKGWVDSKRDHGKVSFADLRDRSALVQAVFVASAFDDAQKELLKAVREEWVLEVRGKVNKRPDKLVNPNLVTGAVEIEVLAFEVLNNSEVLPFDLKGNKNEVLEEKRMEYRYVDLRRTKMADNLAKRHKINLFVRNYLDQKGFWEVETPILTKSTPEGARDYVVPSRNFQGKFYALPQSPQQYKQLLMVGGVDKYFQIVRCFRDEDTRKDRQPEFTQMDLEMSFVSSEDIMKLNEELLIELVKTIYPDKTIQGTPFPRITYREAMEKYGTDRPDLRKDPNDSNLLAFGWVVDFPFFEKGNNGSWTFTHNPFSRAQEHYVEDLKAKKNIGEILTDQYDIVLNGFEIGGGSIRAHKLEELMAVLEILGYTPDKIEQNFGHILKAFGFGVPPHGGIAWGMDRLISVLQNEDSIREVIAFPKTGDGRDPMMDSPSEISTEQLLELGLRLKR